MQEVRDHLGVLHGGAGADRVVAGAWLVDQSERALPSHRFPAGGSVLGLHAGHGFLQQLCGDLHGADLALGGAQGLWFWHEYLALRC